VKPNNNEDENPSSKNNNKQTTEPCNPTNKNAKLSLMDRKFLSGRYFEPPPERDNFIGFRPQFFFLYGSLMDPRQLRKVLRLPETPILQPASIIGWRIMFWSQYPALVFKPNCITRGMVYKVQKKEQVEYLKCYETDVYRVRGTRIRLADGREVSGKTFVWNAGEELLKEGKFDLKDWQMCQLERGCY
jgi:gamma-glutamylcyclotransferase (GGCT)/AIG2-like uncharacterized protein YtfP